MFLKSINSDFGETKVAVFEPPTLSILVAKVTDLADWPLGETIFGGEVSGVIFFLYSTFLTWT